MDSFDAERASLDGPDLFQRFRVPPAGRPLARAGLSPDAELLVIERAGVRRAFSLPQLVYHHVAQGELAGEPYVVAF